MANPLIVDITKDSWVKVATNVVTGQAWRKKFGNYRQTYRLTSEAAPTSEAEGVPLFLNEENEAISSSELIDVYIWSNGADGSIRVDI